MVSVLRRARNCGLIIIINVVPRILQHGPIGRQIGGVVPQLVAGLISGQVAAA